GGEPKAAVGHQNLVGSGGRHCQVDVISGAADQRALPASDIPVFAAIIGTPDGALVGGLDEGVDALGIGGRDGDVDLAHVGFGHAVAFDLLPMPAGVVGDEYAAAGSAA